MFFIGITLVSIVLIITGIIIGIINSWEGFSNIYFMFGVMFLVVILVISGMLHFVSFSDYLDLTGRYELLKNIEDNNLIYASSGRDIIEYNREVKLYQSQIENFLFCKLFFYKEIKNLKLIEIKEF